MAPKYHPTPPSGRDRKALKKELGHSRVMTGILAAQSDEMRTKGEPIDPSPTIDQAVNGG
jgi:hypothetical protein